MPIQITSTTSSIGGVLEEWKALVQRESQMAYRLTEVVEADRVALSSSPVSVSMDFTGEQYVGSGRACALPPLWREQIVEWCYRIIDQL